MTAVVDSAFLSRQYCNCAMSTGNLRDQLYALMEKDKRVHEEYVKRAIELFNQCKDDESLCTPELDGSIWFFT